MHSHPCREADIQSWYRSLLAHIRFDSDLPHKVELQLKTACVQKLLVSAGTIPDLVRTLLLELLNRACAPVSPVLRVTELDP